MRVFYLFYLLAILLLVFGILTDDVQAVDTTGGTTVIKGMWSFFAPFSIAALFIGFVYHFCFRIGRPVARGVMLLHIILVTAGLLFSYNIYRMSTVILSQPDTGAISIESGSVPFFMFLPGPFLLIASFAVFVVGLVKTRKRAV